VNPVPTGSVNIGWESAQALGLAAVLCCLLLSLLPVRPRGRAPFILSLGRHALLGWVALGCVAAHVVLAIVSDPVVLEHLKATTPWYEFAGIVAAVLLLFLTVPSLTGVRTRLFSRHRNFQALHIGASCLLIVLMTVHVVTTARYLHGAVRSGLYLALAAAALLALLRARAGVGQQVPGFLKRLAFGRHAALVLGMVLVCVAALSALLVPGSALALREPLTPRRSLLVLNFPHDKHRDVNCIACHHNFTDTRGADACISCHRSDRPDIRVGAEARFHDFCLGCHRDPPPGLTRHGPPTGCVACHTTAHAPESG
jgi:hypothetical protein